jgi:hypothetical protein
LPYKNPKNRTPPVGGGTYILGEGVIEKFLTLSFFHPACPAAERGSEVAAGHPPHASSFFPRDL